MRITHCQQRFFCSDEINPQFTVAITIFAACKNFSGWTCALTARKRSPGEPSAVCRDRMLYPILLVMDHPRILTLTSSLWLVPAACFIPTEAKGRCGQSNSAISSAASQLPRRTLCALLRSASV